VTQSSPMIVQYPPLWYHFVYLVIQHYTIVLYRVFGATPVAFPCNSACQQVAGGIPLRIIKCMVGPRVVYVTTFPLPIGTTCHLVYDGVGPRCRLHRNGPT